MSGTPRPWYLSIFGEICGPVDRDGNDTVICELGSSSGLRSAAHSVEITQKIRRANGELIVTAVNHWDEAVELLQEACIGHTAHPAFQYKARDFLAKLEKDQS